MIASCTGDRSTDELTFARAVKATRMIGGAFSCIGPLATQDLDTETVAVVLDAFVGFPVAEAMWRVNHDPEPQDVMRYRICAVHWIDLAALLRHRARQDERPDWYRQGCKLLQGMCKVNRWDLKELSNMLISQRVQLT